MITDAINITDDIIISLMIIFNILVGTVHKEEADGHVPTGG